MKKLYIFIPLLLAVFVSSCDSNNPIITEAQGQNEDKYIRVNTKLKWDEGKGNYVVEAKIHNKSSQMINLLFDCNDLIHYPDKTYKNGCDEGYSIGLKEGKSYTDDTEISKNLFKVEDDGTFAITIKYRLNFENDNIKDLKIPLKTTN